MTKLRKLLPLLLVCVILFAFSANATETDYSEAYDALSQLGMEFPTEDGQTLDSQVKKYQVAVLFAEIAMSNADLDFWKNDSLDASFEDVTEYAFAIDFLRGLGIMNGNSETEFGYADSVKYQDILVLAIRMLGYETDGMTYPDGYIAAAKRLSLTDNISQTDFTASLTLGEAAQLVWDMLNTEKAYKDPLDGIIYYPDEIGPFEEMLAGLSAIIEREILLESLDFTEESVTADYANAIKKLEYIGLEFPDSLTVDDYVESQQLAVLFAQIAGNNSDISVWNKEKTSDRFTDVSSYGTAIDNVYMRGIMRGEDADTFGYGDKVTYAEALAYAVRLLGYETSDMAFPYSHLLAAQKLRIDQDIDVTDFSKKITFGEAAPLILNMLTTEVAVCDSATDELVYPRESSLSEMFSDTEITRTTLLENTDFASCSFDYRRAYDMVCGLGIKFTESDGAELDTEITRAELAVLLAQCLTGETDLEIGGPTTASEVFSDVNEYGTAIDFIYEKNLINGKDATTFGADDKVKCIDMLVIAVRALGYATDDMTYPFDYIRAADRAYVADSRCIVDFDANICKGEAVQILRNMLTSSVAVTDPYNGVVIYPGCAGMYSLLNPNKEIVRESFWDNFNVTAVGVTVTEYSDGEITVCCDGDCYTIDANLLGITDKTLREKYLGLPFEIFADGYYEYSEFFEAYENGEAKINHVAKATLTDVKNYGGDENIRVYEDYIYLGGAAFLFDEYSVVVYNFSESGWTENDGTAFTNAFAYTDEGGYESGNHSGNVRYYEKWNEDLGTMELCIFYAQYGDLNYDGNTNIVDVILIIKSLLNGSEVYGYEQVSLVDVIRLLKLAVQN